MKKRNITAAKIALGLSALLLMPHALAKVKVVEPSQAVSGMTYGDWGAAWQQWVQSIPAGVNPGLDNTGANCAEGQSSGPIFFLVGAFSDEVPDTKTIFEVTRDCTVPANRHIFFPIVNASSDTIAGDFFGATEAAQRQLAAFYADVIDTGSLSVTVDGKALNELGDFRAQSPAYHFFLPQENMFKVDPVEPGGYFGVTDGYWVMLKPLSPGAHELRFKGAFVIDGVAVFALDVTYNLTIEESSNVGPHPAASSRVTLPWRR